MFSFIIIYKKYQYSTKKSKITPTLHIDLFFFISRVHEKCIVKRDVAILMLRAYPRGKFTYVSSTASTTIKYNFHGEMSVIKRKLPTRTKVRASRKKNKNPRKKIHNKNIKSLLNRNKWRSQYFSFHLKSTEVHVLDV